jgi:hypothetical protein
LIRPSVQRFIGCRKTGELLQFKDGWDLAASYPESFRQRMIDAKEPAAKSGTGKKRRRKKKAKTTKTEAKAADKSAAKEKPATKPKAQAQPAKPVKAENKAEAAA